MRRLIVALALVAAACGGSAVTTPDPTGDTAPAATSSASSTTGEPSDDGSTDATSSPSSSDASAPERDRPEGPDAPDFTLALGQGGSFTLSEEQKPVYMVFWAEW